MTNHRHRLADGRSIGVTALGEPGATRLVVVCLPTPGAGAFDPDPLVTARSDMKLIEIDRPGYGGSDPLRNGVRPSVERFADDIAEYLVHTASVAESTAGLSLGPVGVIGWSFGGAVAASLTARHPDLVDTLVLVATPSPRTLRKGERYSPVVELRKHGIERRTDDLRSSLDAAATSSVAALGIDEADPALVPLGVRGRIERMLEEGWSNNAAGVASDRMAVRDDGWAKRIGEIRARTELVYGDEDPVASGADARWYAKAVPGSVVRAVPGAGHAVIVSEWANILRLSRMSAAATRN